MEFIAAWEARTSVVVVGSIVPLVPWGQDDLAAPTLLPHVQALPPAVRRLAQQAQLLHKGWNIDECVVVRLQYEPAQPSHYTACRADLVSTKGGASPPSYMLARNSGAAVWPSRLAAVPLGL